MDIKTSLEQIGLKDRAITVYLTLLQLGQATIHDIAKKSQVKRTTTYSILDGLVIKGLATFVDKGGHRLYYAENPRKVASFLAEEEHQVKEKRARFSETLPELLSIYNIKAAKPKIKFYEGIEGLKEIYEETLELKKGSEIVGFGVTTLIYKSFGEDWIKSYLEKRVKGKISMREILGDNDLARKHKENDKVENRQTHLVPEDKFPFTNEINIFGNKISIVSFKELMGVIIESSDVAGTQKAIFELAWLGAKSL